MVWLYDGPAYTGEVLVVSVGFSRLSLLKKKPNGTWDNAIESLKVGPNTTVGLREHADFGGWKYTVSSSVKYLPYFYSNKTSSFRFE